jgi:hypothetical protein
MPCHASLPRVAQPDAISRHSIAVMLFVFCFIYHLASSSQCRGSLLSWLINKLNPNDPSMNPFVYSSRPCHVLILLPSFFPFHPLSLFVRRILIYGTRVWRPLEKVSTDTRTHAYRRMSKGRASCHAMLCIVFELPVHIFNRSR